MEKNMDNEMEIGLIHGLTVDHVMSALWYMQKEWRWELPSYRGLWRFYCTEMLFKHPDT